MTNFVFLTGGGHWHSVNHSTALLIPLQHSLRAVCTLAVCDSRDTAILLVKISEKFRILKICFCLLLCATKTITPSNT